MRNKQIEHYLEDHKVKYSVINHALTYTGPETAALTHIPANELAKTIVIKIEGKLALVVEPANISLKLSRLKKQLGIDNIEIAKEFEFKDYFPGCELGAMPPLGELYQLEVYVDERLADERNIFFNAGTHSELIKMSFKDFANLTKPKYIEIMH